jgi:nitroreductase
MNGHPLLFIAMKKRKSMVLLTVDPRTIDEADFPGTGTSEEQWLFLLNYALMAPSEYNTQPWCFHVQGNVLELSADRSRRLPIVDPDDREMLISCGTACLNLRLAASHFGYQTWVENFMLDQQPDILVRLELKERRPPRKEEERMFAAIPRRHTNRSLYEDRSVSEGVLTYLQREAGLEGTWLQLIQDEQTLQALTQLIVAGDRELWANKDFRQELAKWVRPNARESSDGLPGYSQIKGTIHNTAVPFVVRTFDLWREEAARDRRLVAGAPVLAVLGTFSDSRSDRFIVGQALERVLLGACARGLQSSFVNQPIEVPSLRRKLQQLLGIAGFPQVIIRLGYGEPHPTTSRRSVQDVLWKGQETSH